MERIKFYVEKHPDMFSILLIAVLCGIFLFFGLNFYPLIDVDETRYAVMARDMANSNDWNVLLLNSVPFLEKPPFYFWIVGLSVKLFGNFSTFAVRFPIALMATFLIFYTYFFGKKVISRKFGLISSIVLLTNVFYLIFAHIAILDMVLTVWIASSLYTAFLAFNETSRLKKYYWWLFWVFVGLGFLAKGILALAIPMVVLFIYAFLTKSLKDMFKPLHFLVGFAIFLLIALPWHIIMYRDYGFYFINEYFIKHHFARLIDSNNIGRKHSFFYFIPVFLVAFMPWTIIFFAAIIKDCKKLINRFVNSKGNLYNKVMTSLVVKNNTQKLLLFSAIFFVVVFGVMSVSSTKLPTYILPVIPAAALITGYFWCNDFENNKIALSISTHVLSLIFIIASIGASIALIFLPENIFELIDSFKYPILLGCSFVGILLLLQLQTKKIMSIFSGYVITMLFIITFAVTGLFNIIYSGGENELVTFSKYASTMNTRLVTFDFAVKPSVKINYDKYVYFITDDNFEELNKFLTPTSLPTYIITKNKQAIQNGYQEKLDNELCLVKRGEKYSLYINKNLPEKLRVNPFIEN
ncbi:MAG: ArnT family glycosyltransferase [Candidatus Gastranaerophilaceae bacterium]